jgi:3-phosphoshikimate 1-carboxyvinyltransferase
MDYLDVGPYSRASGVVRLPGSKSISNRVLLLAALAHGETTIFNLLDSHDTRAMLAALETLGVHVDNNGERSVVTGVGGAIPSKSAELFLGNAGQLFVP